MWKLVPGWSAIPLNDEIEFFCDTKAYKVIIDSKFINELFKTGRFLLPLDLDNSTYRKLISTLSEKGIITKIDISKAIWNDSLQSRYFFHIGLNPHSVDNNYKESTALILGLGGTGSIILEHLCNSGIGHLILVDNDIVELSNLQRQFIYDMDSVEGFKSEQALRYVRNRNHSVKVDIYRETIDDEDSFSSFLDRIGKFDVCAICIDQPQAVIFDITSRILWQRKHSFIHGGVMISSGFWGPFFCSRLNSSSPENFLLENHNIGIEEGKICFSPYNTIIASYMAAEILHFLAGKYDLVDFSNRTFLDFNSKKHSKFAKI